jgi:hypothetical protein
MENLAKHIFRGGSWINYDFTTSPTERNWYFTRLRSPKQGFRIKKIMTCDK